MRAEEPDTGDSRERAGRGARVPSAVRRAILAAVVLALVGANAWVIQRQFPPDDRRRNAAYDAGLRALDVDRDFARAELEFRRCLEIVPHHTRVRYLLALSLALQGKAADARAEYGRVLDQEPAFDEARIGLAEIAHREQAYEEALRQLDLARADEPTPTEVRRMRARLLAETGDHEGAIEAYRDALRRDAESYHCALELGDLLLARSVLSGSAGDRVAAAGVFRQAEDVLRRRLAAAEDRRLRLLLAKSIAGQSRVLEHRALSDAVKELRRAADLDPEDPEPALLLGRLLRDTGQHVEARRTLEDARRKWKRPEVLVALFELHAQLGEADEARRCLEDAVAENVRDAGLRVRLAGWLTSQARFEDAERELATAQQLFGDDARVHAARGDLGRERAARADAEGRTQDAAASRAAALAAYRRALELAPRSLRLKKLVAGQLIEGLARRDAGAELSEDEKFARAAIEDVLRVNARDAEALGWKARLLLADGMPREVVDSLAPLLLSPAPPIDSLRVLGFAAARVGETTVAADAFGRVLDLQTGRDGGGPDAAQASAAPEGDWANAVRSAVAAGRVDAGIRLGVAACRAHPGSAVLRRELGSAYLARGDANAALQTLRDARRDFAADAPTRFLLARAYEAAGRLDAAEDELKTALVDLPGEPARIAFFEFLARTGRAEQAEQGFVALLASDPDSPRAHIRLGDFYLAQRPPRTEEAVGHFTKALELTKGGAEARLRIAEVRLGQAARDPGVHPEAEAAVEAFARAAPGNAWVPYLRGKLALAAGRAEDAARELGEFVARNPESSGGLYYHAQALRALGRTEEALAALETAARLAPEDAAVRTELAVVRHEAGVRAFGKGDWEAAQRLFALAEQGGAGRGARLLLAGALANAGRLDVSERECRLLLEAEPRNAIAMHLLAQVLLSKGSPEVLDEVESIYRRALDLDGADALARLGIGVVRHQRGDFHGALEALRDVYPRTGAAPGIALAIAQCMTALGDAVGAAAFLDGEIRAHPASAGLRHVKGDLLVHLRQFPEAVREFEEAYRIDPGDFGAVMAAAAALLEGRDAEGARRLLVAKLPGAREPGYIRLALGETLLALGRTDEAAEELRQSLTALPGHPRTLFLLGRIAEASGARADAKRLYRESVQKGAVDGETYARLAYLTAAEGDRRGAIELYASALRFSPRSVVCLNNMANLLAEEEGRMEDAVAAAGAAARLAADDPDVADTYGWLLFRAGKVKEAADVLQAAANLRKTDPLVQFHAGMALARVRRTVDAREHLDRALRLDPDFPGADAARSELEKLR